VSFKQIDDDVERSEVKKCAAFTKVTKGPKGKIIKHIYSFDINLDSPTYRTVSEN